MKHWRRRFQKDISFLFCQTLYRPMSWHWQDIPNTKTGLEAIKRFCCLASFPLPGTGKREGGEKTQPFNHFAAHPVTWHWLDSFISVTPIYILLDLPATLGTLLQDGPSTPHTPPSTHATACEFKIYADAYTDLLQSEWSGCHTGNRKELSSSQAQLSQATFLAVA